MNGTNVKGVEKIAENKTDSVERIDDNVKMASINQEKMEVIERYEKVLNLLKGVQLKSEEDLVHMKKPLDELESSLKYIPNGPFFNDVFPAEIKEDILNLSYSCDPQVFVAASVCKEWKRIFKSRFNDKKVIIGDLDCAKCGKDQCVDVKDMMKAVATHKLDLDLVIRKPVTQVDSKLIADAFTSVSKLTVIDLDLDHHTCQLNS